MLLATPLLVTLLLYNYFDLTALLEYLNIDVYKYTIANGWA